MIILARINYINGFKLAVEDVKTGEKLKLTEISPQRKYIERDAKKDSKRYPLFGYCFKINHDIHKNHFFQLRFDFDKDAFEKGLIPTLDTDLYIFNNEKQKHIPFKEFRKIKHCHHTEQKLDEETHSYIYPFKVTSKDFKELGITADDLELNLKITRCIKFEGSGGVLGGGTADIVGISNIQTRSKRKHKLY